MNRELNYYRGKSVAITGVCGTVGSELVRQLNEVDDISIVGIDNGESELFFLREQYLGNEHCDLLLGDLRDRHCRNRLVPGVDVVFHAAALTTEVCRRRYRAPCREYGVRWQ